jgi:hypothetical protein
MGQWKAIRLRNGGDWELYNLVADGTETTDLAKNEPDRVTELVQQFELWQKRVEGKK